MRSKAGPSNSQSYVTNIPAPGWVAFGLTILDGEAEFVTGGVSHHLTKGDVITIPAKTPRTSGRIPQKPAR